MSLKAILYPLVSLKQLYCLIFLLQESDEDHHFVSNNFNDLFGTNYDVDSIKVLLAKFTTLFGTDDSGLNDLFATLRL